MDSHVSYPCGAAFLAPLTLAGCALPAAAHAQASYIRNSVLQHLGPTVEGGTMTLPALIAACNTHPEAQWWIKHQAAATALIEQTAEILLRLRRQAKERGEAPRSRKDEL